MRWLFVIMASLPAACGGPQIAEHPKAEVTKGLPATLEATQPKKGEPRNVHVRVWTDAAVRALPHWKDEITDQIDYAGQLLTPLVGVRINIDAWKDWDHTGNDVHEALKALSASDPGTDVTWVIGYIAPADVASKALSELGGADVLGHHIAIRSWADKPETDALSASLPDMKDAARAEVIAAHKRHKQTVVLLHALAQTLGAIAEADPAWIQHPLYSPKQSTLSDRNRELIQIAIDARVGAGTDQTIAHDLLEVIEKHEWGGWIPNDHDEVVKRLRNVADAGKAGRTAADVPAAAYEQFDRVRELGKRGNIDEALTELANLMVAYPGNATMQEQKCELLLMPKPAVQPPPPAAPVKGAPAPKRAPPPPPGPNGSGPPDHPLAARPTPPSKDARTACARVSELAPGDPSPHLAVGEALARVDDQVGAHAELVQAATKIANLKTGQPDAWRRLLAVYMAMGALTWTEEALAAAKLDNDPAAAQIAQTRARYGVPRAAKFVKPEHEAALVAALREANNFNNAAKYADAERVLAAAEKKWPGAAGIAAIRCDISLRENAIDAARAQCQRALAVDADDSWALYLSGVLALKDTGAGGTKSGVDKLKRAITVDPDLGQAWRALAKAYERAHDTAAHDELAKQYQAKFGQALP